MSSARKYPGIYVERRTDSKGRTAYRIKWKAGDPAAWQSVTVYTATERDDAMRALDHIGANVLGSDVRVTTGSLWLGDVALPVAHARTFGEVAEAAIASRVMTARPSTLKRYRHEVTGADRLGRWQHRDIATITTDEVVAWIGSLQAKGAKPATVAARMHVMRLAFRYAHGQGWISRNPLLTIPRAGGGLDETQKRAEMHLLSRDDVTAIIRATAEPQIGALWHVLSMTGLRISEALALQVGSVDLGADPAVKVVQQLSQDGKRIVPPKTRKSVRRVTIDAETADVLRPLVAGQSPDAFVWHWAHNGEPVGYDAARNRWKAATAAAGIPASARMHDLRHAHASWLLADGTVALAAVSARLGHGSVKITADTYAHVNPQAEATVMTALAKMSLRDRPTRLQPKAVSA